MTALLHHTQVARACTDGNRDETFAFVRAHVDAYISASHEFFSPKRRARFTRNAAEAFFAVMRNPRDKTMRDDPTGETAIQNVLKGVSA